MSAAQLMPWPRILDAECPDLQPMQGVVVMLAEARRVHEALICKCRCHRDCDGEPNCRFDCPPDGPWGDD